MQPPQSSAGATPLTNGDGMKPRLWTSPAGAAIFCYDELVYCAGGKNGKCKAEAFMLLATEGRTIAAKARACATGLSFADGLRAGEVFRNRGSK